MTTTAVAAEWVDATAAAKAAGVSRETIKRWGLTGLIGMRALPFVRPRYRLPDVEKIARESTRQAAR